MNALYNVGTMAVEKFASEILDAIEKKNLAFQPDNFRCYPLYIYMLF